MAEINLLDTLPITKRDINARAALKTEEARAIARKFDKEFFDGERHHGYGGYRYDGRWVSVAKRFIEHYKLKPNARILDVGCAKGFLMYDFKQLLPKCEVRGIDVSTYAKNTAHDGMGEFIDIGSAEKLPYKDKSYDLVVSINTIHNLDGDALKNSIREIERVSRGNSFITVDAWRTQEEHDRLEAWILTAKSWFSVPEWIVLFKELGYTGDYWWFIP